MYDKSAYDKEMAKIYREISNKWKERQKIEEQLGIPTSDSLTEMFIAEEYAKIRGEQILEFTKKQIDRYLYGG